jgi:phosphate transport system permease protein
MAAPKSFTGRARRRSTRFGVRFADVASRALITFGGIGTIVAVALVCLFLVWVVAPLFFPPKLEDGRQIQSPVSSGKLLKLVVDEYQVIGYCLADTGELVVFRLDEEGRLLERKELFPDRRMTAWSYAPDGRHVAFGFDDGTVQTGEIRFGTEFLDTEHVPESLHDMTKSEVREYDGGMVQLTPEGQYRVQRVFVELEDPVKADEESDAAIVLLDNVQGTRGPVFCALNSDNVLLVRSVTSRKNLMTGKITYRVRGGSLSLDTTRHGGEPRYLSLAGLGDTVYLAWTDGSLERFDTSDLNRIVHVESVDMVEDPNAELRHLDFMLGGSTLVAGDSNGAVNAWFTIKPEDASTADGRVLVAAHAIEATGSPVTTIDSSARTRMIAIGHADGAVRLAQVTVGTVLNEIQTQGGVGVDALAIAPKDDGLVMVTGPNIEVWHMDPKHPEATIGGLFRPIWYEGYNEPSHTWQSSSGDDAFEPKFGLIPLVFGTIKATVYSMLFAVPLALLAAMYTSEFLHPKVKAKVKPTVEMMASLPSVVLGFLAGLVFAPFVERWLPALLACIVAVPFTFLLGAYLWQMVPRHVQLYLEQLGIHASVKSDSPLVNRGYSLVFALGGVRLILLLLLLFVGMGMAFILGPLFEKVLFAGNIKLWLDGQIGSGWGGWFLALLPISGIITGMLISRYVNPYLRSSTTGWTQKKFALVDFAKFGAAIVVTMFVAWGLAVTLQTIGWDPRQPFNVGSFDVSPFSTYIQRNALIVGFVMGFAVIPIIYTLAEDAMSSVPDHLRSASLAAGATPWQTAVRVIMPTAMSGLFSACMIGLGRAVGETMIVLMAAGNTPVLEMNLFSGFRTLSANIAVELPEAVRDSTHYRTLFLAALTLFVMTFLVNTLAELVRIRFRKRAVSL